MTMPETMDGLPRWGFALPGPLRDEVTLLALSGAKTATTGLLVEYGLDGDIVPRPGERQVLVGSSEQPVAIVETTAASVIRLADVDDAHAIDEAEGWANAAEFRAAHERSWNEFLDELRDRLRDPSFAITDDTQVVTERFRIVRILGPADASGIVVRPVMPADRPAVHAFLAEHHADVVARRGELVDATMHPALIAEAGGALAGVATWIATGGELEILTLHAARRWTGAGTALLAAAQTIGRAAGAARLWLITTNDNLDALRFYQRRGFRLGRVDAGAVDRSRATRKPGIPEIGCLGIPIRDELELELVLG